MVRGSGLARLARADALTGADVSGTMSAARELLAGRWNVFGNEVTLADPPRWDHDPLTDAAWPDAPSGQVDHRDPATGGPKRVWELGRLTMLPTLALAARLGEAGAAERATRWLDDWTARHALGRGVHFVSGIEMAVRVIAASWALMLLGDRERPGIALEPALGLLAQQALHCRDHLSLGSSANNHLIAEYAGMAVLGFGFPGFAGAASLADQGWRGLEEETLRQIHPDGVPAEQAFGYLPFVWELLLAGLLAGEAAGRRASDAVRARLAASLEFARAIRLPDGGWPRVGDEDDGRVLLVAEPNRLDLVGNAVAAWLGVEELSDRDHGLALLLTGRRPDGSRAAPEGVHEFPQGGYTVWRHGPLHVFFDHGPLGLGSLAAHGHADALSLAIHHGADAVVVDPGTFAYQEDPVARDRCRATPAHATVHFGGRSQSEMMGPFLWGRRATVRAEDGGWTCAWADGSRHWRRAAVEPGGVTIEDRVSGAGAELAFPLAPGAVVSLEGVTARVRVGGSHVTFAGEGIEPWRIEPGEVAVGFARREPAPRLVARLTGAASRTMLRIESGPA
jgi:hypothetical protein